MKEKGKSLQEETRLVKTWRLSGFGWSNPTPERATKEHQNDDDDEEGWTYEVLYV